MSSGPAPQPAPADAPVTTDEADDAAADIPDRPGAVDAAAVDVRHGPGAAREIEADAPDGRDGGNGQATGTGNGLAAAGPEASAAGDNAGDGETAGDSDYAGDRDGDGDVVGAGTGGRAGRRGRPPGRLSRIRGPLPVAWRVGLGVAGLLAVMALWLVAANSTADVERGISVPSPAATWTALAELHADGVLVEDVLASGERMLYGYAISIAIGVVVGVAMGAVPGAEGTLEAPIGFLRYVPASALTPIMLMWLGLDEAPKITLIVLGTVFFNILMVADVARSVPRELVAAASTLGASRLRTLLRVVVPHAVPGIVDVARVNLAAGWLMLVVAELSATDEGLAVRVVRSSRFQAYDRMFAVLIVFGVIGMVSDLALRGLRWAVAAWAR